MQVLKKPVRELLRSDVGGKSVDVLLGEPYFMSSLLPWHVCQSGGFLHCALVYFLRFFPVRLSQFVGHFASGCANS